MMVLTSLTLLSVASAQVGLGVPAVYTLVDHELVGPVKQLKERSYSAEGTVLSRAEFLKGNAWISRDWVFDQGRLIRSEDWGGRTDGVANHQVTTYAFKNTCLQGRRVQDLSVYPPGRKHEAEQRDETVTSDVSCRMTESVESVHGKPALRKAFAWNGTTVRVTAFRKDNSVAYAWTGNCWSTLTTCSETVVEGRLEKRRTVTRTAAGRLIRVEESSTSDGTLNWQWRSEYNAQGWLTSDSKLDQTNGKWKLTYVYKYPKVDARGNWLERQEFTVGYEFGKQVLGLTGLTTRAVMYAK
ncbi:hypothetical protein [Deinococcus hohokamensis]|uniref:Uncharacterized protein n=1 Tax=Deinococcus hohokamensis TaxID=309883 RepID=A0ABV9I6I3_9DEIO